MDGKIVLRTTLSTRRGLPTLAPILTRLCHKLAPFYPMPEGSPHPYFPKNLLNYHLLTEAQLNTLAWYYHQIPNPRSPTIWLYSYPACMNWDTEFLEYLRETKGSDTTINAKRRKFGRFIGLRGCETPAEEIEERSKWLRRREESVLKTDDAAFWGRSGWGNQ